MNLNTDHRCDMCANYDKCFLLPCFYNYDYNPPELYQQKISNSKSTELTELTEYLENNMNHDSMKNLCGNCIFKIGNRCPYCLSKFVVKYNNTLCRSLLSSIISILFIITSSLSGGLSYIGIVGSYDNSPHIYDMIGYVIDMVVSYLIISIVVIFDYEINTTLLYLFILSIINISYCTSIYMEIWEYYIQYIHFSCCSLIIYSYYHNYFCFNSVLCQSPKNIKEIQNY